MIKSLLEIYSQLWPNLAANIIWVTPAFIIHHLLIRRHINNKHSDLKDHINRSKGTKENLGSD